MANSNIRRQPGLASPLFALLAAVLLSAPAAATSFTVHGYELGERVTLTSGRQVWTAQFDASLDDVRGISFCVDVDKYIRVGSFHVRDVLDPYTASSPPLETPRDFAFAGSVMDNYGYDVGMLTGGAVTRTQAITGVQAAIWDGIYGGGKVQLSSLSPGARSTYDTVMAGTRSGHTERAVIVEMSRRQDQVFSNPIPEPGAALVFALGAVIVRGAANRRRLV
ncbi:MAG: hypothetical protein GY723_17945 [bacterium]|nr:hypothetical protein [bacterium]